MSKYRLEIINLVPTDGSMVEVGTLDGDFALDITGMRLDIDLTCVDSWEGRFSKNKEGAINRIGTKAEILEMRSVAGSKVFKDNSIDLVYIDAAHDFKSVTEDIEAWYPKVKSGGILAGHDFQTRIDDGYWGPIEVEEAVTRWAKANNLIINVIREAVPSWWVRKS